MFCDARQGSARKPEVIMGWLGLPCLPACVPDSFGKTFAFPFLGNNLTHHLKLERKKKCDPRPAMRARSESRNDYEAACLNGRCPLDMDKPEENFAKIKKGEN